MADRINLHLWQPTQAHAAIAQTWTEYVKPMLMAGHRLVLDVRTETRTTAQNRRLWSLLTDISKQVDWYGQKLSPDDWKDVLTAALKKERVVPGINGGFVVLGQRTSKMTKAEMTELQELIEAFGAERNVKFTAHIDYETGEIN